MNLWILVATLVEMLLSTNKQTNHLVSISYTSARLIHLLHYPLLKDSEIYCAFSSHVQ